MYKYSLLFFMFAMLLVSACSDNDSSNGTTTTTTEPRPTVPETLVAADENGDIFTVNASTGADDLRIVTMTDDAGTMVSLGKVSSMVYVPSMSKWLIGTGGNGFCAGCIQELDTTTGKATTLSTGVTFMSGISGLAINPVDGKIYTLASDSTSGPIWKIDPVDGSFTELFSDVVTGGSAGNGITYAGDVLYHIGDDELYSVDPATGDSSMIATLSFTGFPMFVGNRQPIASLTTRASDGAVFGILKDGGGGGNTQATYLVRVNVTTGEITNVGANANLLDGLAFVPTAALP